MSAKHVGNVLAAQSRAQRIPWRGVHCLRSSGVAIHASPSNNIGLTNGLEFVVGP